MSKDEETLSLNLFTNLSPYLWPSWMITASNVSIAFGENFISKLIFLQGAFL